ncbi:Imm1 family immunity protein [Amycolatopsis sp. CA-230715]|uniref:Imm1 family immunity protein n=1 Tax=Amycolatopsis sp. CA-230715 TaxID=2745196 RepID=UPI001C00EB24|nr:Imm1 family immunity protein [Amycolatopsis sp. CA-230715]QWF81939.1 hypothetical protein HUW46_05374 [Amycolatopsis sp. CA-230715]
MTETHGGRSERASRLTVTASLSNGVARVAHGKAAAVNLIDTILATEHTRSETLLYIGDREYYSAPDGGPIPNHQFRITVSSLRRVAALHYSDHDDTDMPHAVTYDPRQPHPEVDLIFSEETGAVFPRSALIPITHARMALLEWLETRKRPRCVEWIAY